MIHKLLKKYREMPVQVKASVWFLVCSFLQRGITFITTPIFTRLLTTSEYGQFNVFYSWLGIISIFVTLNLSGGVFTQGLVKNEADRLRYASSFQGLSLSLTIIWLVIYLVLREFWNKLFSLTTVQMLAMLLMIWTSSVFSLWAAEQRVQYNYKHLVLVTLIVSFAKPVLGILLVSHAENKVLARILGLALVELLAYTGLFIGQMRRGKCFFVAPYWKRALQLGIPLIPHYLSQTVLNTSDRIMITNLAGDSEAGIYSLAYSLSLIMTLFNTTLMNTISPWIYQKIKNREEKDIAGISYITMFLVASVNILLIIFAPEAVAIFAPEEYYEAIWIVPPVAMSVFFMYSYDLFAKFQFYFEKSFYIAAASVCGAVLNVVLNYIFIPLFGYYAAGYTTLVCYITYATAHYLLMRKVCKEKMDNAVVFNLKTLLGISSGFVLLGFAFMLTYKVIWVRYGIFSILLGVTIMKKNWIWGNLKKVLELKKSDK